MLSLILLTSASLLTRGVMHAYDMDFGFDAAPVAVGRIGSPTYASWLNLVERLFGLLTEKALKRGSHTSIAQLRAAIQTYVEAHNQ